MGSRIKHGFAVVFRTINPNYLAFLAGIMVSAAIELYINMLRPDKLRWPNGVVASSALLLLSSILVTSLSLNLQSLRELAITQSPGFLTPGERETIHLRLISQSFGRLIILTLLSVTTAGIGLLILGFVL